jgi:hypothetical protein
VETNCTKCGFIGMFGIGVMAVKALYQDKQIPALNPTLNHV